MIYISLLFNLSYQLLLKHFADDLYICDILDDFPEFRLAAPCSRGEATSWDIAPGEFTKYIIRSMRDGSVMGVDYEIAAIILGAYSNSEMQHFDIKEIAYRTITISHDEKCVEYFPDERLYVLNDCRESDLQKFNLINEQDRFIVGGSRIVKNSNNMLCY